MTHIVGSVLTRRDQVQAYRFAQARVQTAVLGGNPDRRDFPLRRQRLSVFAGVMVAVVVVCGFGVWGLIRPGGKRGWDAENTLVVEKETGARYVFDQNDHLLHPVLNYTSARLILNTPKITVRSFSQASLARARRGAPRGIVGLPDAIPDPQRLVRGPWVVCSGSGRTTLTVGTAPTGHRLERDRAVLVQLPDKRKYLVWNDTRLEVTQSSSLTALGLDKAVPVQVSQTWVNAVDPGPDLASPALAGIGTKMSYRVGDSPVYLGQVQKVDVGGVRYYLTLPDGLAPISDTVALLLLGNPQLRFAYGMKSPQAFSRAPAEVAAHQSATRIVPEGLPERVPALVTPDTGASGEASQQVCATYSDTSGRTTRTEISVRTVDAATSSGSSADRTDGDTQVVVPPGRAALVRLLPHPEQPALSVFLLTDSGAKFPVPSEAVQQAIGLGSVVPVPLPVGLARLVPTGQVLDSSQVNLDRPAASRWQQVAGR